jgi:hypothetical protein
MLPCLRPVQSTIPSLHHVHSWVDVLSSPLNPDMFAQLAAAGVLGPVAGASSSVPSSLASPARLRAPFPSLDAHNSRQSQSSTPSFATPSHPYQKPNIPDQPGLSSSPYGVKPKLPRPDVADLSSSIPLANGVSHNGLSGGGHITHDGNVSTHSRQGSSGNVIRLKNASFLPSYPSVRQGPPFRQHAYPRPTHRLLVTMAIPMSQLADQMLAYPRRCGCLHLQHLRRHPASSHTHRSML